MIGRESGSKKFAVSFTQSTAAVSNPRGDDKEAEALNRPRRALTCAVIGAGKFIGTMSAIQATESWKYVDSSLLCGGIN